jgi:hypothetical protein
VRIVCHLGAPAGVADLAGAVLRVSVEDVSLVDVSSIVVARLEAVLADAASLAHPVELDAVLDPRCSYAVRVHVSRSGAPEVRVGDLVSVAHHAVAARGGVAKVAVGLVEVTPTPSTGPDPAAG